MTSDLPTSRHRFVAIMSIAVACLNLTLTQSSVASDRSSDRLWLISTRGITSNARCADLESPALKVRRLDCEGQTSTANIDDYVAAVHQSRAVVIYVHGNRMKSSEALFRGMSIYRKCTQCASPNPIDWVIWSWPSEQSGILTHDIRRKAFRTDAQGLYLAWLLRHHTSPEISTTLIGYSFGGRVITGSLHALAGGALARRKLAGPTVSGMPYGAGLIAPAIDSHWLSGNGYHSLATKNLHRMVLMYNRRDIVLKRYWLIEKVRGRMALGYSGPTSFGTRADGSRLPVRSRDCSSSIGVAHDELDYYIKACRAGTEMATLINDDRGSIQFGTTREL